MYEIEKRFTLPIGHRLSKHLGRCSSIHGHNFTVMVGVKSEILNDNYMVIDFSDLKKIIKEVLDRWDHTLLINKDDKDILELCQSKNMRVITLDYDPTAEKLSETIYLAIDALLPSPLYLNYITVYENMLMGRLLLYKPLSVLR